MIWASDRQTLSSTARVKRAIHWLLALFALLHATSNSLPHCRLLVSDSDSQNQFELQNRPCNTESLPSCISIWFLSYIHTHIHTYCTTRLRILHPEIQIETIEHQKLSGLLRTQSFHGVLSRAYRYVEIEVADRQPKPE